MSDKIKGDDGLVATEVGPQTKEKHDYLKNYVDMSSVVRKDFVGDTNPKVRFKAGATYIDLFCGPGRSKIKDTNEWVEGSAIVAWKASVEKGTPFSKVFVCDNDKENLEACVERLKKLKAPVKFFHGEASKTASQVLSLLHPKALNFAFIDPYNLRSLDFGIIAALAKLERPDILLHVSKMDFQRNLEEEIKKQDSALDYFVPNWRDNISIEARKENIRIEIMQYWSEKVKSVHSEMQISEIPKLVKGDRNQHLYWLYFASKHNLAQKFWSVATDDGQGDLFK